MQDVGETFPHAPLQFVVCELRFPSRAAGDTELKALTEALGPGAQTAFSVPALRVVDLATPPEPAFFQIVDRERSRAITLWPSALTLEATTYTRFTEFRTEVLDAFSATSGSKELEVQRIGLRYVDEIHPTPSPTRMEDWSEWVDGRLVAAAALGGEPVAIGGGFTVDCGKSCWLNFRYSTTNGPATRSGGALVIREVPPTAGLTLDSDAFWQPSKAQPVTATDLGEILDFLHERVHELFSTTITDRSRKLFRGEE